MSLQDIHKRCGDIFRQQLFAEADGQSTGPSNACKVYDSLVAGCFGRQDCIGENFNSMLLDIANEWFGRYSPSGSLEYYFCNYTLLMYLCVERVDQIFDVLDKKRNAEIFRNFQKAKFPTLRMINKWANFFKHPKEFLFSHWPTFFFENQPPVFVEDAVVVNYEFIKNHYYSEGNKRPEILQRNRAVYVEVPDLPELTLLFCQEMNAFFEFICGNSIVVEYLRNISTIDVPFMEYGGEEYNSM